jgi:hypothetical protein
MGKSITDLSSVTRDDALRMWARKLIEKKPFKLVAVALANKGARCLRYPEG